MSELEKTNVGFIGTGVMGFHMASHLQNAGCPIHVHNRTKEKAAKLIEKGAVWHDQPDQLAEHCELIFSIVGFPEDVEAIYLGEKGILKSAKAGTILVDMTTSNPSLAVQISEAAAEKGIATLDAPVSGGDIGARDGRLSIMVGGDPEAFEKVLPYFELMGSNIVYQGKAGAGQHTKMCNQIVIASSMLGVTEAIAYARKSGLNPDVVLQSIANGAAASWSLSNLAPRMIAGDFDPGFFVKHFIKDMRIAAEESASMDLRTEGLELAVRLYEELAAMGCENDGTQALLKLIDKSCQDS